MLKAVSYPSVQTCVRMLAVLAAFSPAPTSGWVATTACRSLGGLGSRWMSLSARTRASCGTLATSRMARGLGSVQMRGTESAHGQPPWPRIVIVSRRHLRKNKQVMSCSVCSLKLCWLILSRSGFVLPAPCLLGASDLLPHPLSLPIGLACLFWSHSQPAG